MGKKSTSADFSMDKVDPRLASMYTTDEDKIGKYDRWASSYESDLVSDLDYVAHIEGARVFSEEVSDCHCRILDVACGTGLVGEQLLRLGYDNVDGIDFSSEMLKISRERNIYQQLIQHDFTTPLTVSEQYDALICIGMFSFSIPGIHHMIHVIRTVKPNGTCVISVNGAAWRELDLGRAVQEESNKHGFVVEKVIEAGYIQGEGIDSRVLVMRCR